MIPNTEPFAPVANLERLVDAYREDQTALCEQFATVSTENSRLRQEVAKLKREVANWNLAKHSVVELVSHLRHLMGADHRTDVLVGNAMAALSLVGATFTPRQPSQRMTSSVADSHW